MTAGAAAGLLARIESAAATVGVVGLGYVGLPLARGFYDAGFSVLGFDVDATKIDLLNNGNSYVSHVPSATVAKMVGTGRFAATADFGRIVEIDAVLICVPTPLTHHRNPNLSFIERTAETIAERLRRGQLIVLESTTYPGTTDELVRPILQRSGLKSGRDFYLAYAPEREDPGNKEFTVERIPKVVGADGTDALVLARALYARVAPEVISVTDMRTAEAVKITENVFRAVNIALVNELKQIYAAMDIDVWEVIDAASTKPFGFMPFYPGPGLGGHCIPIDPFYLAWRARAYNIPTRFIELAGEINQAMPGLVVRRLAEELNARFGLGLNGSRILLLGVAYKKNIDDTRGSPGLSILELLRTAGAEPTYHDPFVPRIPPTREHPALGGIESTPMTREIIEDCQAALICTDHDGIDYALLSENMPLVVDTRNVLSRLGLASANTTWA